EQLLRILDLRFGLRDVGDLLELRDVGARDELLLLAAEEHQRAREGGIGALAQRVQHAAERRQRLGVEEVDPAVGIVEPEERDAGGVGLETERPEFGAGFLGGLVEGQAHAARSSTRAAPWPPPTQSVASPRCTSRFRISRISVSVSR